MVNLLDYGARMYDPVIGRFHTQDRFTEKYLDFTPYQYASNNPILYIDINGDSTFVSLNSDGTYVVTGGNLDNKDDKGIYMMGEDGNYVSVGNSLTSHSFFDDDGNAVLGAVIDPSSSEGQDFLDELIQEDPGLAEYIPNATNEGDYDFKDKGKDDRPAGTTVQQYRYRGSVAWNGEIGSARDFGNMGAGIVAARNGLDWGTARLGFDSYQSVSNKRPSIEGITTRKAQQIGYYIGLALRKFDQKAKKKKRKSN